PLTHGSNVWLDKAGVVEILAHLVEHDLAIETRLRERGCEVLAVGATAGVARERRRDDHEDATVTVGVKLAQSVGEIRGPEAVPPVHGEAKTARGDLRLERRFELTVLLVDRADAAKVAVVVRDLFE